MGGIRNDDFFTIQVTIGFVVCFHQQQACKLTMGTGCRLEGNIVHTGCFTQILLSCIQYFLTAFYGIRRLQWMNISKAR